MTSIPYLSRISFATAPPATRLTVSRPDARPAPTPVSYTHLDVYKRQPQEAASLAEAFGAKPLRLTASAAYTHVFTDVYKRQFLRSTFTISTT